MTIHVLAQAQREVREAARWYETRRAGLGAQFLDELQAALEDIEPDPARFPVFEIPLPTSRIIRRRVMGRFHYLVIFEVVEDESRVVAVSHPRREPAYWTDRIE